MKKIVLAALLMCFAAPAMAQTYQDVPLFSQARLSVAGGLSYGWNQSVADTPDPSFPHEWIVGAYASYGLVGPAADGTGPLPTALVYGAEYYADSRVVSHKLGLRVVLFRGRP